MSTEKSPRRAPCFALLLVSLLLGALPDPASAVIRVDAHTRIASLEFRFEGKQSIEEKELRRTLKFTSVRSPSVFRRAVGFLPFVPDATSLRLDPLELQENVVRLRTALHESGFPRATVHYEVSDSGEPNTYDVTLVVEEGPELQVESVRFVDATGESLVVPEPEWVPFERLQRRVERTKQRLARVDERRSLETRLESWWKNRGYAGPRIDVAAEVDSSALTMDVELRVDPGPRSFFGEVTVQGNESIDDGVIARELPFKAGDPYRVRDLDRGQRGVQSLDLIRVAHVEAHVDSADASLVPVDVRVVEAKPRLVLGEAGYDTQAGVSGEASWAHRNFTGGARVLTISGAVESGWGALVDDPEQHERASVTLRQPYVIDRRVSLVSGPFLDRRDDLNDRSWELGANATLVYEAAPLRVGSLSYEVARRRIGEYRIGFVASGSIDLLSLIALDAQGALDSLGSVIDRSEVTLAGTWATREEPNSRRSVFAVSPSIRVTVPSAFNKRELARLDATATGQLPLTRRIAIAGRFSAGRLFPFGKSVPGEGEEGSFAFLRLRDVSFTGGGESDVRGWQSRLLGPKFPDVRYRQVGDSLVAFTDGFVPIGGLSRISASAELRLPFPGLGRTWGTHVFLDAGRVWTADDRFAFHIAADENRVYYGTGAGVDYKTVVGSIRLSVGYKLNPGVLDLADADEVAAALLEERPLVGLSRNERRRWQLHLSFGTSF